MNNLKTRMKRNSNHMNVWQLLQDKTAEAVKKLGVLGTISYIGALFLFILVTQVDFKTESLKVYVLSFIGTTLLIFSGIIYWLENKEKTVKIKEALGVLKTVYNQMADHISTSDKDKTVSITMTINNLPDKIFEAIKKIESR